MELDEETIEALGLARLDEWDAAAWFGGRVAAFNAANRARYRDVKRFVWLRGADGAPRRVRFTVADTLKRCTACRADGHNIRTCLRHEVVAVVVREKTWRRCRACSEPVRPSKGNAQYCAKHAPTWVWGVGRGRGTRL